MHICLALLEDESDGPVSGTGETARLNAEAIRDAGSMVTVVMPAHAALEAALEPYAERTIIIPSMAGRSRVGRAFVPALKAFRSTPYDIIHFHAPSYRWGVDAVYAANLAGARLMRTEQNPVQRIPSGPERLAMRVADRRMQTFVYVSAGNQRRFEAAFPWRKGRGTVVGNAIDPDRLAARLSSPGTDDYGRKVCEIDSRPRLATFVSSIWALDDSDGRRPIGPVLRAMAALPAGDESGDRPWHLAVIGRGDFAAASVIAASLGLAGRVHFLDRRSDAFEIVASSDLLVSASHFEGCAVTYLEAWFAGVPVLSTRVDGVEDIMGSTAADEFTVVHGDTGRFAALWAAADDPGSRFRLANVEATERVRTGSTSALLKRRMVELYNLTPARRP